MKNLDYKLTDQERQKYRESTIKSALAKREATEKGLIQREINSPRLNPDELMPRLKKNGLRALSLFSGGGGLDLGFERAGYKHVASFDILSICGETLRYNRPDWEVHDGAESGDVNLINIDKYIGKVDIVHGGPPCQPFSVAGQQAGENDERNMWGPFVNIVNEIQPSAFVAENVKGILDRKFQEFVEKFILSPLSDYHIHSFTLNCAGFGVPQKRERVFFVGFRCKDAYQKYRKPEYTHDFSHLPKRNKIDQSNLFDNLLPKCLGVREALGLDDIGRDALCPTIRSAFTGKRNTTSILNSTAAARNLEEIEVWGSGVAADREKAAIFPTQNGHFRLSVQDCAILQGFPETWKFEGAVYKVLGQIGNSVSPPVAYHVAKTVKEALS